MTKITKTKELTITQLKAEVKAAATANAKKLAEATEKAILKAKLKLESSEVLFNAKVLLAISSKNIKTLQDLVDGCEAIVDSVPVHNNKTRAVRKWSGNRRFTFGDGIDLMYQLSTGILYSCAEHKQLLLAHTGLEPELLSQFVEAMGSPAYYNRNFHTIVEAKPYDMDKITSTVAVMQSCLGVIIDTSQLTVANLSLDFGKGEIAAETDKLKADEAIKDVDLVL